MTFFIRLVLLPLTAKQYKTQLSMKTKMNGLKPEMTAIQQKIKETKDPAKQKALQQEMMQLYQKHGVNPLNMGCLPLLIQMPILMGFYYAIQGSHEIATHSFLWFSLGQPNIAMAIIAGVIYYFQSVISMRQMPEEQQKQMKIDRPALTSNDFIHFFLCACCITSLLVNRWIIYDCSVYCTSASI